MAYVIFWNCRGARKWEASLYFREILKDNDCFFVGLTEKKISCVERHDVDLITGSDWYYFHQPVVGLSGGILVLWKRDLASFEVIEHSFQLIVVNININALGKWNVATVYGAKEVQTWRNLWQSLEDHMLGDLFDYYWRSKLSSKDADFLSAYFTKEELIKAVFSQVSTQELAGEHHVIDVKSLLPSSSCSMPDKSTSPSKLTVVHRDGWCSSRARQDKQSHVELLRRDQARVKNIHQQAASPTSRLNPVRGSLFARVPANIGKAYHTVNYIITIGLGTPTKFFTVEFDTGSDLSWTQCAPCYNCYTQKDPFYDPTQSSTFSDILCTSDYCFDLDQFGCSSTSTCLFHEEYHDYSYTNGSFVQDTLTFSSDIIQNFRFGCGHNNTGQFGQLDGLLGLGRGAISIISQTAQLYNKVFSYCLPSRPSATGYLELGSSIPGVIYTPMLTDQDLPSFYFIKLIAISIGGSRLDLSPTVFTDPGTILDSGTVISYLPPTAYSALRNTFRQYMTKYPVAPPLPSLDTCYDLTNYTIMYIPSIALIFDGEVTTTLDSMGIVYGLSKSQVCLAFTENNDDSVVVVIGNVQQRRFNIVYDVGNLKIGFGANGCD
ncbi:aspartyl protease family protein At5g10770-like [Dendrobium catenatum]|uniref:aspartyl protease family protein At5g10770-like n=1 Tax=Dendrobium catenatum TaxID=906689 RepID=UPI0009F5F671|nr:aspartyl protease family protein At5g10770-like [Dendrobium catenatum]